MEASASLASRVAASSAFTVKVISGVFIAVSSQSRTEAHQGDGRREARNRIETALGIGYFPTLPALKPDSRRYLPGGQTQKNRFFRGGVPLYGSFRGS